MTDVTTDVDLTALGQSLSNDAEVLIDAGAPYVATVTLEGTSAILFHRWSNEDVAAKRALAFTPLIT